MAGRSRFVCVLAIAASGCSSAASHDVSFDMAARIGADGATSADLAPASKYTFGTYDRMFARTSPWNIKPVAPVLGDVGVPTDLYYPAIAEGAFSTGVFLAKASDPAVTVYPQTSRSGIDDPDSSTQRASIVVPHWPADALPATGGDGHCDIFDPTTGVLHSFWQLVNDGGTWRATQWAWAPVDGRGWGDPAHYYQGARAAAVPASAGIIRKGEYRDGDTMYRHALAMSMTFSGLAGAPSYVFPSTSGDSTADQNTGHVPEGGLVMLPADFDVDALKKDDMKKVARTLMAYGARVVDRNDGTPYIVYVEIGTGWVGHGSGWDGDYAADLDAVRAGLHLVSSESGWTDVDDNPVTEPTDGSNLGLFSMRGDETLTSGTVLGTFDTLRQAVTWGPTGSTPSKQINYSGIGYDRATWGRLVVGATYAVTVTASGGATLSLEVHDAGTGTLLHTTGPLGDGTSATLTWVDGAVLWPVLTSGTSVGSSLVSGRVLPL